jgi:transaldolase
MNRLGQLHDAGVSIWLDTLSRPLLEDGEFERLVREDVLYVEKLIAPGVINTMPEQTMRAFADHGNVAEALDSDLAAADGILTDAASAGLNLQAITADLERDGVTSFCDSYHQLLDCVESKLTRLPVGRE